MSPVVGLPGHVTSLTFGGTTRWLFPGGCTLLFPLAMFEGSAKSTSYCPSFAGDCPARCEGASHCGGGAFPAGISVFKHLVGDLYVYFEDSNPWHDAIFF